MLSTAVSLGGGIPDHPTAMNIGAKSRLVAPLNVIFLDCKFEMTMVLLINFVCRMTKVFLTLFTTSVGVGKGVHVEKLT